MYAIKMCSQCVNENEWVPFKMTVVNLMYSIYSVCFFLSQLRLVLVVVAFFSLFFSQHYDSIPVNIQLVPAVNFYLSPVENIYRTGEEKPKHNKNLHLFIFPVSFLFFFSSLFLTTSMLKLL